MILKGDQDSILSFEDIDILIDKYSRLNKKNYAEIMSQDFDGEAWKKEGKKIMSYVKVFEVLKNELESKILNYKKEGNLDMLHEAKVKLEKVDMKIIPFIEEIKKISYYFEVKVKKIGKFKNSYKEILIILKNEVEEKKRVEELSKKVNKKYLDIEKEIRKVANEYHINYYVENYNKKENLINNKDKEDEFIGIKIKDEEEQGEEIKEEDLKEEIKEEEINEKEIKEEIIKEEEYKKLFDEKFSLEEVKNWLIKNWFIFIFFLFFFMLGFLVGKI